tara:strand:- start:4502 stop:4633 length:132 start_codon:yes stop_codon:yes gene_type:complete
MSNGKGSKRREMKISQEKYYENWNKIFNKKNKIDKTKKKKRED